MVAIVTGKGTGLERSSAFVLGSQGQLGGAALGRDGEGVYVNAANGNLLITRQDEFLIGLGADVSVNRTYNSRSTIGDGDNEDNWRMSAYRQVTGLSGDYGDAGTTVTRIDWDGSETVYTWVDDYPGTAEGAYVATDGAGPYDILTRSGTDWTWIDGSTQLAETYDETHSGRLTRATDTDGNIVDYAYDGSGRIATIVSRNASGGGDDETIAFTYVGANLTQILTTTSSGSLTRVRYGYESYGTDNALSRLTSVTVDLSPAGSSVADGYTYVTTYAYADTSTTRIAAIRQQDGSLLQIGYDESGRVSYYTQAVSTGVTRTTSFDYSMAGRTIVTDPAGQKTALFYDVDGNLTGIAYPSEGNDVPPRSVQFAYNTSGDVTQAVLGPGNLVTYTYDEHGNCVTERDSAGNTVDRSYSDKNELLLETRYLATNPGNTVTTRYAYNSHRHLVFEVSAEGNVIEHRYDGQGRRTVTIAYAGEAFDLSEYDSTEAIEKDDLDDWALGLTTKANALRTERSYDFRGNLSTVTTYELLELDGTFDESSQKTATTYVYDQTGNLLSRAIANPDPGGPSTLTETFVYDGLNRMRLSTDFYAKTTSVTFLDSRSQTLVTHANGVSEITTFNRAGEIIASARPGAGANLLDLSGWPGDPGSLPGGHATLSGWANPATYVNETSWAATTGPDGFPVAAMQAGQSDAYEEGGGNYSNEFTIDGAQAYEFTYYFRINELNKHGIYFGLSQSGTAYVDALTVGPVSTNPYFLAIGASGQETTYSEDTWYKVVGYVLPEGATAPGTPVGGVYDMTTGEKVADTATFRWNADRPDDQVLSRFFNYWGAAFSGSTSFYKPEVRQVAVPVITNPDALTTQYRYDNLGRLRLSIDPTGRRQFFLYDTVGRRVAEIDNDGTVTEYRYDGNDNVTSTTRYKNRLTGEQLDALADTDQPITLGLTPSSLLTNGSFDTSDSYTAITDGRTNPTLPGWTDANGTPFEQITSGHLGVNASNGAYWLDMDSLASSGHVATGSNLLTNGSFDTSGAYTSTATGRSNSTLPGWTKANGETFEQVTSGQLGVTASNGAYWLDTDSVPTGVTPVGSNLVVNGSFETSASSYTTLATGRASSTLPGWTKFSKGSGQFEQVTSGQLSVTASDGNYWLDLDGYTQGNLDFGQTIGGLVAGQTMLLQFDSARRNSGVTCSFEVYWNNALVATITPGTSMAMSEFQVTAVAGNNDLRFKATGTVDGVGASLDNVRLFATEPVGGNMDISQTISGRTAGEVMEIQFDHANRTTSGSGSFEVYWNGVLIDTVTSTGTTMATWTQQVAAAAGDNTLRFKGIGAADAAGASLDNVQIHATTSTSSPANMDISQIVGGLDAGEALQLKFDHANRTTSGSGSFEVYWNGTLVQTITSTGTTMTPETLDLVAIAGNNSLRFKGIGTADGSGASLDNVRLFAQRQSSDPLAGIGDLRPLASADDSWTFNVYDTAQRLVQTIDALGATTLFEYDDLSRLSSTRQFSNRIAAADLATLKARATAPNLWASQNAFDWFRPNLALETAGTIDSETAYKFTVIDGGEFAGFTAFSHLETAGQVASFTISMLASGPVDENSLGISGWVSGWGDDDDSFAIVNSGPGTISRLDGGLWKVDNLSATVATRVTVQRRIVQGETIEAYGYIGNSDWPSVNSGDGVIVASAVYTQTSVVPVFTPAADPLNDRVTRNFYDDDGRLVGTLDAEGYLTEIRYDAAGQKTMTIGYSDATDNDLELRADGSFSELHDHLTEDDEQDIRNYFVYDSRGLLRGTVDGEGGVTQLDYDATGALAQTRTGAWINPATLLTTPPTLADVEEATGSTVQTLSYLRDGYGNIVSETHSLTGADEATTEYAYDSLYRLVSTTSATGERTFRRYDPRGNVTGMVGGIGTFDLPGSPTDAQIDDAIAAHGSTFVYDEADRLVSSTDPDGNRMVYYYDADGQLAFQVDPLGAVTEYRYDSFGRNTDVVVHAVRIDSGTLATLTGGEASAIATTVAAFANLAADSRTRTAYDVAGQVRATRDALGHVTVYDYNSFGELTTQTSTLESGLSGPPQTIVNFSFEAPDTGPGIIATPSEDDLFFEGRAGITGNGSAFGFTAAPDGDQVAYIGAYAGEGGAITETVRGLTAGGSYQLSFYLAQRPGYGTKPITVLVDGFVLGTYTPGSASWTQFSTATFQASSATAVITFRGAASPDGDTGLDKITLASVPDAVPDFSFETPEAGMEWIDRPVISGMQFDGRTGVTGNGSAWGFDAAPDGDQVAFIQTYLGESGSISQTLTGLSAGNLYTASFYLANRPGSAPYPVTVSLDGVVLGVFTPGSTSFTQFTTVAFQAVSSTAVLTFSGGDMAGDGSAGLDKVTVTALAADASLQNSRAYDRRGLLKTEVVDSAAGGKQIITTYGYDAFGRTVRLTNALDQATVTTYDRAGRAATVTDALNNETAFEYDARGNLVAVIDANDGVTHHVYDKAGRQIATIDALGGVVTTTYDDAGRVIAARAYATRLSGIGALPYEITETALVLPDADTDADHVTHFAYDEGGRLRFTIDGLRHVVETVYDDNGNVIRTIVYDGVIGEGEAGVYSAAYVADEIADLALDEDQLRVTSAVYDAANRLVYAIDALGRVVWSSYDAKGLLVKQVAFDAVYSGEASPSEGTMDGWRTLHADPDEDRTTRAFYDNDGQLTYSVDALGYVTHTEYDALGNVTRQSRYIDSYPADDDTTGSELDVAFGSPDADTRVTQFAYDTAGRLVETTDPGNIKTRLVLDAMGQVISSIAGYDTDDAVETRYNYDDAGRLVQETRGFGEEEDETSTSWFFYDGVGQRTASVDPGNYLTVWTFDAVGNLETEYRHAKAITDDFTSETDVVDLRAFATTDDHDVAVERDYDAFGRLKHLTDARGFVISTDYDVLDRVTAQTEEMESGSTDDRIAAYTYDNFGDLVKVHDARENDSFSYYDKLGRVFRQVDAGRYVTDTAYTSSGQVASVTRWANAIDPGIDIDEADAPADPVADTDHDATTTFAYNKRGELESVTDAETYTESYLLNAFGERTTVRNKVYSVSFDTSVVYTYNKRGQVLTETLPIGTKTALGAPTEVVNRYEYDARGNRVMVIEADGAAEMRTTIYAYDSLDRVTSVTHDAVTVVNEDLTSTADVEPTEHTRYDTRGNIVETEDAGGGHTYYYYDHLGRVTAQVSAVGGLTVYAYDKNGNLTSTKAYDGLVSLPPDSDVVPTGSGVVRETLYEYDASNRLSVSTIKDILVGDYGGEFEADVIDVSSTQRYDAAGNVIDQEDGRGGHVYTWYDKLGRKLAQVDAENYLTTWDLDAEGNVLSETRFARLLTSFTAPTSSAPGTPPTVAVSDDDRTTIFTYDRNGRRLTEERQDVVYTEVSEYGEADTHTGTSIITYTYNGLGQVIAKCVNGHDSTYDYDEAGRLTEEVSEGFIDYEGNAVVPRTTYAYDGLNNVTSTRIQADAIANDANDRITTYTYGAGGRLASTTVTISDEEDFTHNFGYDRAGRMVRDSYTRALGSGGSVTEAQVMLYDLGGRVITQTFARFDGSAWVFTDKDVDGQLYDAVRLDYNVFGDVIGRGVTAGPSVGAVYQEHFYYDNGGRVWKSNEGDGVLRFYVYDAAGNRALSLSSTGADLSALTEANYVDSIQSDGDTDTANAVTTLWTYDLRGMQTATIEPDRERGGGAADATYGTLRSYNAFGELAAEVDARGVGYRTEYAYNTMGRLIQKTSPEVAFTDIHGVVDHATPVEIYGYDLIGRLVSVTDANGNVNSRHLLAGTGLTSGEDPLVTVEFHADGEKAQNFYDVFGDLRIARNELYLSGDSTDFDEVYAYDKLGRVTSVQHRGDTLTEFYEYDGLGQRIITYNDHFTITYPELTDVDYKGRVTQQVDAGGHITAFKYSWDAALGTGVLGTFGGWVTETTYANGKMLTEKEDLFGHKVTKTDLGDHVFTYAFDRGGRLASQAITGETITYSWFNTGLLAGMSDGAGAWSSYSYDKVGNRLTEQTYRAYANVQDATAQYDALNRMTAWHELGTGTTAPESSMTWAYDLNGNIRHTVVATKMLNLNGTVFAASNEDLWYLFDPMNRVTTDRGYLDTSDNEIKRGGGTDYLYDAAGRREQVIATATVTKQYEDRDEYNPRDENFIISVTHDEYRRETYHYDARGNVLDVKVMQSTAEYDDVTNTVTVTLPPGDGTLKATMVYDAMGRLTEQTDLDGSGFDAFVRQLSYTITGQIGYEATYTTRGIETSIATTYNQFGTGYTYALGAIISSTTTNVTSYLGSYTPASSINTTNTYEWWDGAVQNTTTIYTTYPSSSSSTSNDFYYGPSGQLSHVQISDGRARSVTFTNDMNGQALRRDEALTGPTPPGPPPGNPHEVWYRFNGKELGYTGNNGTLDTDYISSIDNRVRAPSNGPFQLGSTSPYTDFDPSLDRINSYNPGGAGSYTVRAGDTLSSIAASVWGDASLWYQLAEANGLSAASALTEGQTLSLPGGTMRNTHNASTFKPYDPSDVLGNVSPTNPKMPKKPKCGVIGAILMVAIAVALTVVTTGVAAAALTPGLSIGQGIAVVMGTASLEVAGSVGLGTMIAAGAIGGAVGSIGSQAFGVITGLQDKFSWKGVAMGAISGAIGAGLSKFSALSNAGPAGQAPKIGGTLGKVGQFLGRGGFVSGAVRGAASSALSQGIGVATGLQDGFSWASVATAAIGGGVSSEIGSHLGGMNNFVAGLVSGAAGGIANAATRTILTGTSFGDNVMAVLPDVIGSSIGNLIGSSLAQRARAPTGNSSVSWDAPTGGDLSSSPPTVWNEPWVETENADIDYSRPDFTPLDAEEYFGGPIEEVDILPTEEDIYRQIVNFRGNASSPQDLQVDPYEDFEGATVGNGSNMIFLARRYKESREYVLDLAQSLGHYLTEEANYGLNRQELGERLGDSIIQDHRIADIFSTYLGRANSVLGVMAEHPEYGAMFAIAHERVDAVYQAERPTPWRVVRSAISLAAWFYPPAAIADSIITSIEEGRTPVEAMRDLATLGRGRKIDMAIRRVEREFVDDIAENAARNSDAPPPHRISDGSEPPLTATDHSVEGPSSGRVNARPRIPTNLGDILSNPAAIYGRSIDDIAEALTSAGYRVTRATPRAGTSGRAQILHIAGSREFNMIQVHPGGGIHGGGYLKISTTSQGVIKFVSPSYVPTRGEGARIIWMPY